MISVIVPIYNSEKWLKQCINSVLKQKKIEFELLLIDDGSTDKSEEICNYFVRNDSRVHYFKKENGGVSQARNFGIEHSTGDWITFLDSDDYLEENILAEAEEKAVNNPSSMVVWNAAYIANDGKTISPDLYGKNICKEEIAAALIYEAYGSFFLGYFFRAVWGKFFNREIIIKNNIRFDESLYLGEDAKFLLQYIHYIDGVSILNKCGYNYRLQSQSAVHRYKKDLLEQSRRQLKMIKKESLIYPENEYINTAIVSFLWGSFNALVINEWLQKKKQLSFQEAILWYEENKYDFMMEKIKPEQMSKFLRLEMYASRILPLYFIARMSFAYSKRRYKRI
ncbi:glycosyltransferase [Bifidobacterium pullorum subsp. saeculare]|uniref:glycosyltransferase family 2 protein n=1 Tax=Bifidobacterium pullorum TaxID=78448 RepID=UPI001956A958|nr:glycosyltransferase family 2 protein [Bifidobacterium pullorum]MBM6693099.1 glycosyltransferase [Bifidobacterium pullorum subsp. saeculare]